MVVGFPTCFRILATEDSVKEGAFVVVDKFHVTGQVVKASGDFEQVVGDAGFLWHAERCICESTDGRHAFVDACTTCCIGFSFLGADVFPEVQGCFLMEGRIADFSDTSCTDHFCEEGICMFVEVLSVGECLEDSFGLFPLQGELM